MKYQCTKHWTDPIELRGLIYFSQRFDELTWAYTLDSYRAPTTNPPALVIECLRNIRLYKKLGRPPKAVAHIVEETRKRLKGNPIASECISLSLEKYFDFELDDHQKSIDRLTMLVRELSQPAYLTSCIDRTKSVVPTNRKSDIEFAARELASTLLNIGYSARHLSETCQGTFFDKSKKIENFTPLTDFLSQLEPTFEEYSIFFDANSKIRELDTPLTDGFSVKEIKSLPKRVVTSAATNGVTLPVIRHKVVAFDKIEALDRYGALVAARGRLNWIHDIYGLFRHRNSIELATEAVVISDSSGDVSVLRTDENHMHQIADNRRETANSKLKDMLVSLRLPIHQDKNRFFRVINFHGLASRTASSENQLINLWTALETITSSHSSSASIVDTVTREIVPVICLNYAHRLFRSLMLDLLRWDKSILNTALSGCEHKADDNIIHKVFDLIVAEENDSCKEAFLSSISDFELMRFRLFTLNKELSTGRGLIEKIERHERLVTWQIHRVYRARNQIVHSSSAGSNIDSLIVSAHDYFDQVFEVTAKLCSGSSGFNTYDEVFKYCDLRYVDYKKMLKSIDRTSIGDTASVLWQPREPM